MKSIAALHCLTQDVQHSTRYPKTHVGGPDLDYFFLLSRDPSVVGSLDFWFKLHTAAASRIQEWLDHRQEVQRALEIANKENEARTTLAEVQLLKG